MDKQLLEKTVKGDADEPVINDMDLSGYDYRGIDLSGGAFNNVKFRQVDFTEGV